MRGSCGVARVPHGKGAREFLVLPTGQERYNQERPPRYMYYKFEYTDSNLVLLHIAWCHSGHFPNSDEAGRSTTSKCHPGWL